MSTPMISRSAALVHGVGDHHAPAGPTAAVADLLDLDVNEQIRVAAFQRAVTERLDLVVEAGAHPGDLALGDPQTEALDQLIDLAGAHPAHIRLLHHRHQRLL
jgi:hypothetical protein